MTILNKPVKIGLLAIFVACLPMATHAQLVIGANGKAHIGDTTVVDTAAILHVAGNGVNGSKGFVSFGDTHNDLTAVCVGEYADNETADSDRLWLYGRNGMAYTAGAAQQPVMSHEPASPVGCNFSVPVSARAAYIATDPRLNSTTQSVTAALQLLQGLDAIGYRLHVPVSSDIGNIVIDPGLNIGDGTNGVVGGLADNDGAQKLQDSLHYGLTVESVQQHLPQLVTEDAGGTRYVDYNSMIPLLVVAVNELRAQIDTLAAQIGQMQDGAAAPASRAPARAARHTADDGDITDSLTAPALFQNIPNPFTDDTHIRYCLPEEVAQADLYIYDMQGHQIRRIAITERGESAVTIHGSDLQPGMYIYALIADGQEIDSKRMILTK